MSDAQITKGRLEGAITVLETGGDFNREELINIMLEAVSALEGERAILARAEEILRPFAQEGDLDVGDLAESARRKVDAARRSLVDATGFKDLAALDRVDALIAELPEAPLAEPDPEAPTQPKGTHEPAH